MNSKLLNVNSIHLQFLSPLLKWRILGLKELREEINYPSHPTVFEKLIRRLERAQVINSFRDPWSNQKFIFLSDAGGRILGAGESHLKVTEETMLHDAKVAQFTRLLINRETFYEAKLEHDLSGNNLTWQPDSILWGKKKGKRFTMAFELELTRKSKSRIREKIRKYLTSTYYDYVLYLFCSENVMRSYQSFILEEFGDEAFKKVLLFWNPSILSRNLDLTQGVGFFKSQEVSFNDIF